MLLLYRDWLYVEFYESFVASVDAVDNGVSRFVNYPPRYRDETSLALRVARLNPQWNETPSEADRMRAFLSAVDMVGVEITSFVRYIVGSLLPARSIIKKAMEERWKYDKAGRILVLPHNVPWNTLLPDMELIHGEPILYVVSMDSGRGSRFSAVAVRTHPNTFESRLPFPPKWRGLRDEAAAEATGVEGTKFVHASGFLAASSSMAGIIELCNRSFNQQDDS
jgi:uncharacterized UPF0160 family protein